MPERAEPATSTVLVTGGSRGIGEATCRLAAAAGWAVGVNYTQDAAAAERVVAAIRDTGGTALAIRADVADDAAVAAMFARVDAELPPLAGLVNNAGIVGSAARIEGIDRARLERMFAVNVYGSFRCAAEAVRRMKARGGGTIVNLSSAAAKLGAPGQYVDYAAAKGAIETFTIGLAKEVAGDGIRVNAVRPGLIDTEIHASGGMPDRARQLAPQVPMQRPGTADEVAEAIVWLLSERSRYTTGSIVEVTGGR